MNTRCIKRCSTKFIIYQIFILIFSWQIPLYFGIALIFKLKIESNMAVDCILGVIYLPLILLAVYQFDFRLPQRHKEKLLHRFHESEFKDAFLFTYEGDYCLIDETKGRIGVLTKQNPYRFQILDAALVQKTEIEPPLYQRDQRYIKMIGLAVWMQKKKYVIFTYNQSQGTRTISYIDGKSKVAQDALHMADQLAQHIQHAKEVALRKQESITMTS